MLQIDIRNPKNHYQHICGNSENGFRFYTDPNGIEDADKVGLDELLIILTNWAVNNLENYDKETIIKAIAILLNK